MPEAKTLALLLRSQVRTLAGVVTPQELGGGAHPINHAPKADDIAFLQYTSGSTGTPKGVVLTHANLLANLRTMGPAVGASPNDTFVSWLPLYHDMGLIGAWLESMHFAGRNIYPYQLEEAVGNIPGIRKGCVAVFGSPDPRSGTERVVVLAETREKGTAARICKRSVIYP